MQEKYYLVYDKGYDGTIYGVGRSIEGAYQDASQWVDSLEGFAHAECDERLYYEAMQQGGADICISVRRGFARIACAPKN